MRTFDEYAALFDRADARFQEVLTQMNAAKTIQGQMYYLDLMRRLHRIMEGHLDKMRELSNRTPRELVNDLNVNPK